MEISYQTNSAGMTFGETKELSSTSFWLPFGKFTPSFSQLWFQNISGTTPSSGIQQSRMRTVEGTEDFFRTDVSQASRDFIVNVSSILHGHGPKRRIISIRPSQGSMQHNGPSSFTNCLDSSFRNAILMLSTSS